MFLILLVLTRNTKIVSPDKIYQTFQVFNCLNFGTEAWYFNFGLAICPANFKRADYSLNLISRAYDDVVVEYLDHSNEFCFNHSCLENFDFPLIFGESDENQNCHMFNLNVFVWNAGHFNIHAKDTAMDLSLLLRYSDQVIFIVF